MNIDIFLFKYQVEWSHFHKQFHFIRRALQEVNYHLEERKALPEELRQEIHRDYEDWPGNDYCVRLEYGSARADELKH